MSVSAAPRVPSVAHVEYFRFVLNDVNKPHIEIDLDVHKYMGYLISTDNGAIAALFPLRPSEYAYTQVRDQEKRLVGFQTIINTADQLVVVDHNNVIHAPKSVSVAQRKAISDRLTPEFRAEVEAKLEHIARQLTVAAPSKGNESQPAGWQTTQSTAMATAGIPRSAMGLVTMARGPATQVPQAGREKPDFMQESRAELGGQSPYQAIDSILGEKHATAGSSLEALRNMLPARGLIGEDSEYARASTGVVDDDDGADDFMLGGKPFDLRSSNHNVFHAPSVTTAADRLTRAATAGYPCGKF